MDGWIKKPEGWNEIDKSFFNNKKSEHFINLTNEIMDIEVLLILAGGLTEDGKNHSFVQERLDLGISIYNYKKEKNEGLKIICLGGGTYHKSPILNKDGFVIHESTACSQYLIENGIEWQDIIKEWGSYDTIANAYFALTNFVLPTRWIKFGIITSDFHMKRSKFLFDWIFSFSKRDLTLVYFQVKSKHNNENKKDFLDKINLRYEKEEKSLQNMIKLKERIKNLDDFFNWFYLEHKAYHSKIESFYKKDKIDEKIFKTY